MRLNFKMTITMLLFSLLVTGVILASFFFLRNNVKDASISTFLGDTIFFSSEDAVFPAQTEVEVSEAKVNHVSASVLDKAYQDEMFKYLPAMALVICSAILLLTFLLWLILQRIYRNQMLAITHDLNFIDQLPKGTVKDEVLSEAFNKLKNKFDSHMEDYRRLNSYLTHEQKNAIAILRTNLELERQQEENQGNLALLDRLTDSIDDILTLSNNTADLGEEVVDVSLVCAEVCDAYKRNYPELLFAFDEEEPTIIQGRDRWIYRTVSNLVDNAIKYGEGKPVSVSISTKNGSVVVQVKDRGMGIPKEKQMNIFSHHYRVHGLKQDGYGIGLSVVSHVCDLCRGFVYLESEERRGSTFYLSFPSVG